MRPTDLTAAALITALWVVLMCAIPVKAVEITPQFLAALSWVESKHNPNAVGDNGKALGCFQLHKIHVRDVNRIIGREQYTYADRRNPRKSAEMVVIYLNYYGRLYERKTGKKATFEILSRIHNGGPNGWTKVRATNSHWRKVKSALAKIQKGKIK